MDAESTNSQRTKIVETARETAKAAVNKPYIPGGRDISGFDCSGFVTYVYQRVFPHYQHLNTSGIENNSAFKETKTPQTGDIIFFTSGTNPYEVKKKNNRVYPAHVGIMLDDGHWIGSQTSTGVAQVSLSNPWWAGRAKKYFRYAYIGQ